MKKCGLSVNTAFAEFVFHLQVLGHAQAGKQQPCPCICYIWPAGAVVCSWNSGYLVKSLVSAVLTNALISFAVSSGDQIAKDS